jgi:hypothetical protein
MMALEYIAVDPSSRGGSGMRVPSGIASRHLRQFEDGDEYLE